MILQTGLAHRILLIARVVVDGGERAALENQIMQNILRLGMEGEKKSIRVNEWSGEGRIQDKLDMNIGKKDIHRNE